MILGEGDGDKMGGLASPRTFLEGVLLFQLMCQGHAVNLKAT